MSVQDLTPTPTPAPLFGDDVTHPSAVVPAAPDVTGVNDSPARWEGDVAILAGEALARDAQGAATLLYAAGRILEDRLRDASRALDRYEQAAAASPASPFPPALRALRRLAMAAGAYLGAAERLDAEIAAVADPAERADLLVERAALYEDQLLASGPAREALEAALAIAPAHRGALAHLQALAERAGDKGLLRSTLEQRLRGAGEAGERARILARLGLLVEGDGAREVEALGFFGRSLDDGAIGDSAPIARAGLLRVAARLGRDAEMHRAVAAEAEAAPAGPLRAAWRTALSAILRHRLGETERAGAVLEAALVDLPKDLALLAAVADDHLGAGRWSKAIDLLDRQADLTVDAGWAAALRGLGGHLAEMRLHDDRRAAQHFRVVLLSQPADAGALAALGRIAARAGDAKAQAEAAEVAVAQARDPAERAALLMRAAEIDETGLRDRAAAAEKARRALDAVAGYGPARLLLERLFAELGRWEDLARLLAAAPGAPGALGRLGALYEERLDDPGRAMALYGEWVSSGSDPQAANAALLRAAERADDALVAAEAALGLGRAATEPAARVAWLYRAATLYEERGAADEEAGRAYQELLVKESAFRPALAGLARVLHRRGAWEPLCDVLARQSAAVPGDGNRAHAASFDVELARVALDHLSRPEVALAAADRSLERDPAAVAAALLRVRALHMLGRGEEMAAALGRLADRLSDPAAKAACHRRQAEIIEWKLRKPREALVAVERALGTAPDDVSAALAQERILQQLGRHADACTLREKRLAAASAAAAPARRLELASRVVDPQHAVALVERTLEEAPGNVWALEARLALLRRLGRDADLGAATARLAEATQDAPARAALWRLAASALERAEGEGTAPAEGLFAVERMLEEGGTPSTLAWFERVARRRNDLPRVVLARRLAVERAPDGPARALALWDLSLAHAESGDVRGAGADLERALEADPRLLPAIRDLARLRERLREPALAAELYKREAALVKAPAASAAALDAAARLYSQLGDDVSAAVCLEQALGSDPEAEASYETLEALLVEREDFERLARVLTQRARSGSKTARRDRLLRLATLLHDRQGRGAEAVEPLRAAVDLDPTHVPALVRLGELLGELRRPAEAIDEFRRVIAASHDEAPLRAAWLRIGELADRELGDLAQAAGAYRNALLVAPDDMEALRGLADVAQRSRDHEGAAGALRRLAAVEPRPAARVEHWLALADLLLADPAAAADAVEQALEVNPTHGAALDRFDALCGELEEPMRLAAALDRYLAAAAPPVAIDADTGPAMSPPPPDVTARRIRLAKLLTGPLGAPERAVTELRLAVRAAPGDADARGELARLLAGEAGRPGEAITEHLQLLRVEPLRLESLKALRALCERTGDGARAGRATAVLVALRAADAGDERRVREARTQAPREPSGAVTAAEFDAFVRHPDERHPATALLAAMVELLPRLYPVRVEDWGVTRTDRIGPRSEDPIRPLVDRVASLLGVGEPFDVYVARARVRDVDIDATEPPALMVAANLLKQGPRRDALAHLGRSLGRLRARTHGAGRLAPKDLDVLVAAAVRTVFSDYGHGLASESALDELSQRINRAVPRKGRKLFEQAVVAVGEAGVFDLDRWRAGLEHTGHRAALVASGDVVGCFDAIVRADRRLAAAAGRSPEDLRVAARASSPIVEMVNFALGDDLAALHKRLGI